MNHGALMTASILDGKLVAHKIQESIGEQVKKE